MKTFQKLLLLIGLFASTILPQSAVLTPDNTFLAPDVDNLILYLPIPQWPLIPLRSTKLIKDRHDFVDLAKTFWYMRKSFSKKAEGIYKMVDAEGNAIHGLTHRMLTIGMRHKESTRFIARLLTIIEKSRRINKDVLKILCDTKLPIIWVTNKDSLTYQRTLERHVLDSIAIKTIVTKQPLSKEVIEFAQRADTPADYRALVEQYQNDHETETLIHTPSKKPDAQYYECLAKVAGPDKNIIFIDDTMKNITGYLNALRKADIEHLIAIHYQNKDQLVEDLNKLGLQPTQVTA